MKYERALAVDLGGTFLRSAVVGAGGELAQRTRVRLRTVFDGERSQAVWDSIVARLGVLSESARCELGDDAPLVVAFPGPVGADSTILCAPTLTGAEPVPTDLTARIVATARRRVHILNDVAAAALHLQRTTGSNRFVVVTVSSGIGSRVVCGDSNGTEPPHSGEIGHLVVDRGPDAPPCDCGGRGHLGSIASGRGFERAARREARADPNAFDASACVRIFGATAETLANERHLVPAILAGDAWTTGLLRRSIETLAAVLFNTVVAAGSERVYVIGGFATALGARYESLLESAVRDRSDSPATTLPAAEIVRVLSLDEEACLLGAAAAV